MIYLITGGERSGKSKHAQKLALTLSSAPLYLATARRWDKDFENRINRHKDERDERWTTIEEEKNISQVAHENVVVLDCITLWLTNIFSDVKGDLDQSLSFASAELKRAFALKNHWIIVTNEIGMGVHAATEAGRKFVELQGLVNQSIAENADEVFLMVSGVPFRIKQQRYEEI